jgi:hypothetical protein
MHSDVCEGQGRDIIEWRFATRADIVEFYGHPPPATIRAIVVTRNGEPVGIGGVARDKGLTHRFFSDHKPEFAPHLKTMPVLRAIKAGMKMVDEYPGVVMAFAQDDTGAKLLERLGFKHIERNVYAWLGQP